MTTTRSVHSLTLFATILLLGISGCGGTPKTDTRAAKEQAQPAAVSPEDAAILKELRKICTQVTCRPVTEVKLMVDEERFFQTEISGSPYVYDDLVEVVAGERFFFEADLQPDGTLTNLKFVKSPVNPQKTFEVSLSQTVDGRTHKGMILKIVSPFDGIVRYRAGIGPVGASDIFKTSTCPLRKGVPVMEMWSELLLHIVLADFRVVDPESEEAKICN